MKGQIATHLLVLLSCALFSAVQFVSSTPIADPFNAAGFRNTTNTGSRLGTNLAGIADWSTSYPFIDYMKMSRPWFSASTSEWENKLPLDLDSDYNVKSLQTGQHARSVLFTGSPPDPSLFGKTLHVYYLGDGELIYNNVDIVSRSKNFDVIKLKSNVDELIMSITITRTNPTNPIRTIRVVPPGGICVRNPFTIVSSAAGCAPRSSYRSFAKYSNQIVFNPEFLTGIKSYENLRFMDWQKTNNSPVKNFSPRALASTQFWSIESLGGVPLEVMISLANLLNVNAWFCVPHEASDAWVTSFAQLLKSQLKTKTYIEYSNEVWNGMFTQKDYCLNQGSAFIGNDGDAYTGLMKYYSKRSVEIFDRIYAEFDTPATASNKIIRVMATQAVVPYFSQVILSYGNAAAKTDVFAVAPYFGDTFTSSAQASAIQKLGVDGVLRWLNGEINVPDLEYGSLPTIEQAIKEQAAVVVGLFKKQLVAYEGGQHLLATGSARGIDTILDAVNRDPKMKSVYLKYLGIWKSTAGAGIFNHYVHCDRWSEWGRWGAQEYQSQPLSEAPKLAALMEYIASN